jgi:hypothetical protein
LPEAMKLSRHLTAASAGGFSNAIRDALARPRKLTDELKSYLAGESWENKADYFVNFVLEGI